MRLRHSSMLFTVHVSRVYEWQQYKSLRKTNFYGKGGLRWNSRTSAIMHLFSIQFTEYEDSDVANRPLGIALQYTLCRIGIVCDRMSWPISDPEIDWYFLLWFLGTQKPRLCLYAGQYIIHLNIVNVNRIIFKFSTVRGRIRWRQKNAVVLEWVLIFLTSLA